MKVEAAITNSFIADSIRDRVIDADDGCIADQTKEKVSEWHRNGSFVVANAGAYDVLGLNHLRGLMQARIIGAAYALGSTEDLTALYDLASSSALRLLVSLDTNEAISENKSFLEQTGLSVRPILDWQTRSTTLALQSMGGKHNLVDFITKHGPSACTVCGNESCPHSSETYNVASSGADLTIIKVYSPDTFSTYPYSQFHVINEQEGAFFDKVLDAQISTTALVRRIKSKKV